MPFITRFKIPLKVLVFALMYMSISACTSTTTLMFVPFKNMPVMPSKIGLEFEEVQHQAADGTKLVSWWLPAQGEFLNKAKGTVLFLHGNAQNISYHQFSANWLPNEGYNVFMLGYREYGLSEGLAMLPDIFMDVHAGLDWILANKSENLPVVIFGQSMGASLAVYGLASYSQAEKVDAVILDAGFSSYPEIAATAMSRNWFSWPLIPAAWAITDEYDPESWIAQWPKSLSLLMFHSPNDQIVPYDQGRNLFDHANEPKLWQESQGRHIATFRHENLREVALNFMGELSKLSN